MRARGRYGKDQPHPPPECQTIRASQLVMLVLNQQREPHIDVNQTSLHPSAPAVRRPMRWASVLPIAGGGRRVFFFSFREGPAVLREFILATHLRRRSDHATCRNGPAAHNECESTDGDASRE